MVVANRQRVEVEEEEWVRQEVPQSLMKRKSWLKSSFSFVLSENTV